MRSVHLTPLTCPLNIQFILQGLIDQDIDKLCFYCEILLQTSHTSGQTILEEMRKHQWCTHRLFDALVPFLFDVRFDENVLVYLIENKDKLNSLLGKRRIEDLLQNFFPAGHDELRTVIHEGYTRRGSQLRMRTNSHGRQATPVP